MTAKYNNSLHHSVDRNVWPALYTSTWRWLLSVGWGLFLDFKLDEWWHWVCKLLVHRDGADGRLSCWMRSRGWRQVTWASSDEGLVYLQKGLSTLSTIVSCSPLKRSKRVFATHIYGCMCTCQLVAPCINKCFSLQLSFCDGHDSITNCETFANKHPNMKWSDHPNYI
jgi:hypothetical protein